MAKDTKVSAKVGVNSKVLVAAAVIAVAAGLVFSGLALGNLNLNKNFKISRLGPKQLKITNGTYQDFGKFVIQSKLAQNVQVREIIFDTKIKGKDIRPNVKNLVLLVQPTNCGYGNCPVYYLNRGAAINKNGKVRFANLDWWLTKNTQWEIILRGDVVNFKNNNSQLEFYIRKDQSVTAAIIEGKGGYGYPSQAEKIIYPNTSGARNGTRLIFQFPQNGYGYRQ